MFASAARGQRQHRKQEMVRISLQQLQLYVKWLDINCLDQVYLAYFSKKRENKKKRFGLGSYTVSKLTRKRPKLAGRVVLPTSYACLFLLELMGLIFSSFASPWVTLGDPP